MLTYILFKTKSMLLSATSRKGQPHADLHPVQNPQHTPVSNKQGRLARCWLTNCSKCKQWSCQQQAGRASQMLTYILFKTQSIILSATTRKGQPECWLTACSIPKAWSCKLQAGRASPMLTYSLFKTQSMVLLATSRKGQQLTYSLFTAKSMVLSATSRNG